MYRVLLLLALLIAAVDVSAQTSGADSSQPTYYSQVGGVSLREIVIRAIETNGEIKIAMLEVNKARARLTQAGLRPNPTLEVEQTSGRLAGTPGDNEITAGVSLPLELYGQRDRRVDRARAEIVLKEAEILSKQREVAAKIFIDYADALAAFRELTVLDELIALDLETAKFVQIRVNEGETAPLELSLLQTEIERLRVHRQLVESKLEAAITKLKYFANVPYDQPLKLAEDVSTATLPNLPPSIEIGFAVGVKNRPEIRLAELEEQLFSAGLRLIRSEGKTSFSAFSRFTTGRSTIDLPIGVFPQDRDRSLTFGVSIGLPVFNRNQGAIAEAEIAIQLAREKRTLAEKLIRNEIVVAFQQIEAARRALNSLQSTVLPRSRANIETMRRVYELGEIKITDLLAEQRRLLEANRDLTETFTRKYKAEADLFIALGLTFDN